MDVEPVNATTVPTDTYQSRPPSPPCIHVPVRFSEDNKTMQFKPTPRNISSMGLSEEEFHAITHGAQVQRCQDHTSSWSYDMRYDAQPIIDWIELGPSSAARKKDFLERRRITMVLAVRAAPSAPVGGAASRPNPVVTMGPNAATKALGIPVRAVELPKTQHNTAPFTQAIRIINEHVVRMRSSPSSDGGEQPPRPDQNARVLVVCETGNDRSPIVVAAYLIAMFGLSATDALCFIGMQRFSTSPEEQAKRLLCTWEDLLEARYRVNESRELYDGPLPVRSAEHRKRGIEDTFGEQLPRNHSRQHQQHDKEQQQQDDTAMITDQDQSAFDDANRFGDRKFAPFSDKMEEGGLD